MSCSEFFGKVIFKPDKVLGFDPKNLWQKACAARYNSYIIRMFTPNKRMNAENIEIY